MEKICFFRLEVGCVNKWVNFKGHQQTIFITVNRIGPLGGEGIQLKSVKNFTFVMKIEISNILLSILKE